MSPGKMLKRWRTRHGLTISAMAADVGLHPSNLGRIENGVQAPDLLVALELERVSGGQLPTTMWRMVAKKRANSRTREGLR